MSKFRRRLLMGQKEKLPYKRLAYIESTGIQYIDTGYYPNSDIDYFRCNLTFKRNALEMPFGCTSKVEVTNANKGLFFISQYTSILSRFAFGNGAGTAKEVALAPPIGEKFYIEVNNLVLSSNAMTSSVNLTPSQDYWIADYPLYLFARNSAGSPSYPFAGFFEGLISKEIGNMALDIIPVILTEDVEGGVAGEAGIWNLVTKKFHGNKGTGSFIAGPELII